MPDTPEDPRTTSIAALDEGWGDLLDAPPPVADGIPVPTPVPLRTRVPTKPVLRGIREESQPIDIGILVRHKLDSADAVPQEVLDDAEPIETPMVVRPAPIERAGAAFPGIVDDRLIGLPGIVDDEPPLAATPERIVVVPTPIEVAEPIAEPIAAPIAAPIVAPIGAAIAASIVAPPSPMIVSEHAEAPRAIASALPVALPLSARPVPTSGRRTQLLAVSAVVGVLAIVAITTRSNGDATEPQPHADVASTATAAAGSATRPRPAAVPVPTAAAEREPALSAATPTPTRDEPPPVVAPPSVPPPVEAAEPDDPLAAAQGALDAGDFLRAHALARTAFKADRDNEAMRVMATAACQLDDGALAREAYRSLSGPQTRTDVFSLCRARGVDVRAKTDGYTPTELLAKARRLADLGDPTQAYEIARGSNREKRSGAALELMGVCACRMKDAEKAAYVAGLIGAEARARIVAECTAQGLELPSED